MMISEQGLLVKKQTGIERKYQLIRKDIMDKEQSNRTINEENISIVRQIEE